MRRARGRPAIVRGVYVDSAPTEGYCLYIRTVADSPETARAPRYSGRPMPRQLTGGLHGLSRAEVTESQRARALQALVEVVGERGFAEAKVADVLDRAGISRKTFYELFATKEECLFAVFDEAAQCVRGAVRAAMERGVTPHERLDSITGAVVEWVDAEPELSLIHI